MSSSSTQTGVTKAEAQAEKDEAQKELEQMGIGFQSIGICTIGSGYGYLVSVHGGDSSKRQDEVRGVPIRYKDLPTTIQGMLLLLLLKELKSEQPRRPLTSGLEIQNFDWDRRSHRLEKGLVSIGTIGAFVKLANGRPALITTRHTVFNPIADTDPVPDDRILQPASSDPDGSLVIARLTSVESLTKSIWPSLPSSEEDHSPEERTYGEIDLATATLEDGVKYEPTLLGMTPYVQGLGLPELDSPVLKAGRTTGLTRGRITSIENKLKAEFDGKEIWFTDAFTIESDDDTPFAEPGDSGAAIVSVRENTITGMIFLGSSNLIFAFPLRHALKHLDCALITGEEK